MPGRGDQAVGIVCTQIRSPRYYKTYMDGVLEGRAQGYAMQLERWAGANMS